jgi:hypothetical protein
MPLLKVKIQSGSSLIKFSTKVIKRGLVRETVKLSDTCQRAQDKQQ